MNKGVWRTICFRYVWAVKLTMEHTNERVSQELKIRQPGDFIVSTARFQQVTYTATRAFLRLYFACSSPSGMRSCIERAFCVVGGVRSTASLMRKSRHEDDMRTI